MNKLAKETVPVAGLTAAGGILSLLHTAIEGHRKETHRSLAFKSNRVEQAYRTSNSHLIDPKLWAAVHRVHHSTPDANLEPFVEIADYADWHTAQTTRRPGQLELPNEFAGLDPAVKKIPFNTAYEIGALARDLVVGRYKPAEDYSLREAGNILYNTKPRYFYEDAATMKHDQKHPVTLDPNNSLHQIRFLLRDPHSPALHPQGIPGVMRHNVPLYSYAHENIRNFVPDDLQPDELDAWTRENRAKLRLGYVGAMALAGVALSKSNSRPEKIARGALLGSAASGLAVVALIAGGNVTNAMGHAGDLHRLTFRDALAGKVYPKTDGTYTTNNKLLSPMTLDEVGGQEVHHDHPNSIAYSLRRGVRRFIDAPFGSTLETMAKHGVIFKPGDQFNTTNPDQRPDMPSPAVIKLQEYRAEELARDRAETT
jgi:hypothetical protein